MMHCKLKKKENCGKRKKTLFCDFLVTVGTFWSLKFFVVLSVLPLILCFQYWSTVYHVVFDTPRWFSPAFWSLALTVLSLPLLFWFWAEFCLVFISSGILHPMLYVKDNIQGQP